MASRQGVATGGGPGWCRGREAWPGAAAGGREPVSAARAAVTAPCPLEAASPWPRCRPPRFRPADGSRPPVLTRRRRSAGVPSRVDSGVLVRQRGAPRAGASPLCVGEQHPAVWTYHALSLARPWWAFGGGGASRLSAVENDAAKDSRAPVLRGAPFSRLLLCSRFPCVPRGGGAGPRGDPALRGGAVRPSPTAAAPLDVPGKHGASCVSRPPQCLLRYNPFVSL